MSTKASAAGRALVKRALSSFIAILFLLPSVLRADYSTNFDLTENPISEGGKWQNGAATALDWKNVRTSGGIAFGTQTGNDKFLDSTALLTGTWDPNQSVSGVVHTVNQSGSVSQEVEFRLRSTLSAHVNSGYEINFRCTHDGSQYVQIVKWNGPVGDFTYIDSTVGPGVRDGDTLKAEIIGTTINAYINGKLILSRTDSQFSTGNPGIGFYLEGGNSALNADFGFTSITATGGTEVSHPTAALGAHTLTVSDGRGSGQYTEGTRVPVSANAPAPGQKFDRWTGDWQILDNFLSPTTTALMLFRDLTINASYRTSDTIRYLPLAGYAARMVGGVFEGTNGDPVAGLYTPIYKITAVPPAGWSQVPVSLGSYRYLRYRGAPGTYSTVAEIEFYRAGVKLEGTGYGSPGSWANSGSTFDKAFDGNSNTIFNGPAPNGNYAGLDTAGAR